jgi:hypothetical protein
MRPEGSQGKTLVNSQGQIGIAAWPRCSECPLLWTLRLSPRLLLTALVLARGATNTKADGADGGDDSLRLHESAEGPAVEFGA